MRCSHFGLTDYADERLEVRQTSLCPYPSIVMWPWILMRSLTQTFSCWYHQLLCDLQFSFMWSHTNLFALIPSILIHVRSHKPLFANNVNCYVTFDSHSREVTQLFVPIQSIAMWPSNLFVEVKLYQGIYISKQPIGNLTQIVLLTNYFHPQNKGLGWSGNFFWKKEGKA